MRLLKAEHLVLHDGWVEPKTMMATPVPQKPEIFAIEIFAIIVTHILQKPAKG
jgi:hypothetical protein